MRTFIATITIIFIGGLAAKILPWYWWYAPAIAFLVAIFMQLRPGVAFRAGFFGVSTFWLIAILIQDILNDHILSARMAGVFGLPGSPLFIFVNVLLGGLVGGLAGWSGGLMNKAFRK